MSFSFTRKTDYALVGLASLGEAEQYDRGPVSARQIAEEFDLPLSLLMNVMKDLNRAGLVDSKRGPSGGYTLARSAEQITIADVIEAIEGPVALTACCDESTSDEEHCLGCRLTDRCPISGAMQRFNDLVVKFLQRMTLAEMMKDDVEFTLSINPAKTKKKVGRNGSQSMRLVEVI